MPKFFESPAMVGRMSPPLFSGYVGRKARFAGDPWPDQLPLATWYWMHADGCWAGSFKTQAVHRERWHDADWFSPPTPLTPAASLPQQDELFA